MSVREAYDCDKCGAVDVHPVTVIFNTLRLQDKKSLADGCRVVHLCSECASTLFSIILMNLYEDTGISEVNEYYLKGFIDADD